jgi:hypothetical protein
MSPLIERRKFATLVGKLSFGYCSKASRLWFFLKLRYYGSRGSILQGIWQSPQTIDRFFEQFSHMSRL